MNRRTLAKSFAVVLPLTAFAACGIFSAGSGGLARVNALVGWVERVHVESELSKERVRTAIDSLHAVVARDFEGDVVEAYVELVEAIEHSRRQAAKLRTSIASMKRSAEPVFERWSVDLEKFTSMQMRQRSRVRLADTRRRYDAIVDAADPAQTVYDEVNLILRDHALYLHHDLNPASVSEIGEDIRAVTSLAVELESRLDACLDAAQTYIESAALPAVPPAAPGGAAPLDEDPGFGVDLPSLGPVEGPRKRGRADDKG